MTTSLLLQHLPCQGIFSSVFFKYLIKYLIVSPIVHQNWAKLASVMRDAQVNTAPPEAGAAGWGPAKALENELPQVRTVQADFSLALERYGSESAVLVLTGELDLFRAPAIEDALAEVRHLTVDLRSVTFIDVSTLVLLLGASRRQQADGGQLLVIVGPQTPMTAFEATGFDRLLVIRRLDNERTDIALRAGGEWPRDEAKAGAKTLLFKTSDERSRAHGD
jgi:anti-anti-sigma factor